MGCASSTYLTTSLRVAEQTVLNRWTELHGVTYSSHVTVLVPHVAPGLSLENPTFCPRSVFMCFVWIWEQTAIISLYSTNWLVFITEIVFTTRYGLNLRVTYINPSKPSGHYMYHQFDTQQFYVLPTVYLCILSESQNKQRLFPYAALTEWFL